MRYLSRAFGSSRLALTLPTQTDVDAALAVNTYDAPPWDTTADITKSFRNNLEGGGVPRRLHTQVHFWVGGDTATMQGAASPNDPVFFLHHSNIDRIWAHWQEASAAHTYQPTEEQRNKPGVSLHAVMPALPGNRTPADVLDHRALGYAYDTPPATR
jgi:tyrosinase